MSFVNTENVNYFYCYKRYDLDENRKLKKSEKFILEPVEDLFYSCEGDIFQSEIDSKQLLKYLHLSDDDLLNLCPWIKQNDFIAIRLLPEKYEIYRVKDSADLFTSAMLLYSRAITYSEDLGESFETIVRDSIGLGNLANCSVFEKTFDWGYLDNAELMGSYDIPEDSAGTNERIDRYREADRYI